MNITSNRTAHLAVAVVATASLVAVGAPAQAKGGDAIVKRGNCSAATDWKLKVKTDDSGLEVEGEIDSNKVGQTWTFRLVHNGVTAARGTRTTKAPSGSFEVRRVVTNLSGTDTLVLRAADAKTGESCVGTVKF